MGRTCAGDLAFLFFSILCSHVPSTVIRSYTSRYTSIHKHVMMILESRCHLRLCIEELTCFGKSGASLHVNISVSR